MLYSEPARSPHLNHTEHQWTDLKTAAGRRRPSNLRQLKTFVKEQWTKPLRGVGISLKSIVFVWLPNIKSTVSTVFLFVL